MRARQRKRPHRRQPTSPPAGIDLADIAARATYVGSPEHKTYPSFMGRPRSDASKCDPHDFEELTGWLRNAIRAGAVGAPWEGEFPRYVWHRDGDTCYEGRLVNRELGQYKGYPDHCPDWLLDARP